MAIKHSITLSTTEPNNEVGVIKIRQADEQTQTLEVQITENGVPKSYTGLAVYFCAKLGQTAGLGIIEQKLNPEELTSPANGKLEYTMRAEDWQILGRQRGYFSFRLMLDEHEFIDQFTTRDFTYNVIPSITGEIKEVKKDGSTYIWTIEEMIRLFKEYISTGKIDWENYKNDERTIWEKFVEDNREFLESADPGGKIILELLGGRGGFDSLGERLDESDAQLHQTEQNLSSQLAQTMSNVKILGAIGDGKSHPLSEKFSSLPLARVVYPHATDLSDEIDWCAIQLAIDNHDNVFLPEGQYIINKTINITSSRNFKGSNRKNVIITQISNNIPILRVEGMFHDFSNFSVKYDRQQTRSETKGIGIVFKQMSQSNFMSISMFNVNTGIAPEDLNSWNYTVDNLYIEGFSLTGVLVPRGSGATYRNVYICKPYLTAYSGFEIDGGDYVVIEQLNIEGWYDLDLPYYGEGKYEIPVLVRGSRVTINGLSLEAVTLVGDNGIIVVDEASNITNNVIINHLEMYHIALNTSNMSRGAIVYTKTPAFITINGLTLTQIVGNLKLLNDSNVYNSLLVTDTSLTRAVFTGVADRHINLVGTNDHAGGYGSGGYARNYLYVTNEDSNRGVALIKVNDTVYTQTFMNEVISPKFVVRNGGFKFPSIEFPVNDPNTLDDYREGSWIGNLLFGGYSTGITFNKNEGFYTKIGRVVYFSLTLILSSKGSATGTATINKLPYDSTKKHSFNVTLRNVNNINGYVQGTTKDSISNSMDFEIVSSTGVTKLTDVHINNNTEIVLSGFYQI